jgi:outer membrane protein assembly factor BamE (lipoprotein component of BamABCDE complex)
MSYTDIPEGTHLVCNNCGAKFTTYYYDRGYISHNNNVNNDTLTIYFNSNNFDKKISKYNELDKKCAMIWRSKKEIKK